MTSTAKQEAEKFEILDHRMTRITVVADGSFDEFQARFDATMPASTPQDIVREVKNWQQAVALVEAKALFGLLIYRKGQVHAVMGLAGHTAKCAYYLIGNFTVAERAYGINPSVFLYFPFQVCLWEGKDGRPRVSFDQSSSALAVFQNDAISKVAREFDLMFGRLLQSLGCVVPDALRQPAN
jgi:uncharacterized protein (DUF302 family)